MRFKKEQNQFLGEKTKFRLVCCQTFVVLRSKTDRFILSSNVLLLSSKPNRLGLDDKSTKLDLVVFSPKTYRFILLSNP